MHHLPQSLRIVPLREQPPLMESAAQWFHAKWHIPLEAYRQSMHQCLARHAGIPQWYVVLNEDGQITAGLGAIENDFHNRPDLTPNVCAVYVEEAYRRRGIAHAMLDFVRRDLAQYGVRTLYLVTDHTDFYERCGWSFLTMVTGSDGERTRMYAAPTL